MILYAIPIILLLVIILLWVNKIHVDTKSFFAPTLPLATGKFGVYCFTGKQGSGKTYSLTKYVLSHVSDDQVLYSNVTLIGIDYIKITSVDHLLSLSNVKDAFIVYDEVFTLMAKSDRIGKDMMEFLSQQRKMGNIFMTTAQEWLELSMTFRRFVRIQIDCQTIPWGKLGGLLVETYHDAYNMKWDPMQNEYIAPRISKKFSKYEKRFMESYDTFERIRQMKD